uniref:Uncharacterized mitochondrial protein AtMg00810-like n=1 Tax=Nicotiana tabacum TaxID=4097 RepID=A0A1S4BLZ0_TOBAC|nr:PREDICTED: uncharacterized mitochondrial protein AtMg00810-like [Nicotiana tabacum]
MKDLGELKFFLGSEFARSNKGTVMSQRKYALELIAEMRLRGVKSAGTPLEANVKLTSEEYDRFVHYQSSSETEDKLLADAGKYQRLIGRLLYLTMTRVDIAYVVQVLSQYMHEPKQSRMEATLRVVRLFKELGVDIELPITLNCDNKDAIQITGNPIFHEKTKHIDIDCHFVREKIVQGSIKTHHVSTKEQQADLLTKSLGRVQHDYLMSKLRLEDIFQPSA